MSRRGRLRLCEPPAPEPGTHSVDAAARGPWTSRSRMLEPQPTLTEQALPLRGRHAVVTGASRGIGAAIAAKLAGLGADVTLMSRTVAQVAEQASALAEAHGGRAQGIAIDVARPDTIAPAFALAASRFGVPHI